MFVCALWLRYYTFNCMCLHSISHPSAQTADSQPVCRRLPAVSCSLRLEIVVGGIPSWSSPAAGGRYFLLFPPYLLLSSGGLTQAVPTPSSFQPWSSSICHEKAVKKPVMAFLLRVELPSVYGRPVQVRVFIFQWCHSPVPLATGGFWPIWQPGPFHKCSWIQYH